MPQHRAGNPEKQALHKRGHGPNHKAAPNPKKRAKLRREKAAQALLDLAATTSHIGGQVITEPQKEAASVVTTPDLAAEIRCHDTSDELPQPTHPQVIESHPDAYIVSDGESIISFTQDITGAVDENTEPESRPLSGAELYEERVWQLRRTLEDFEIMLEVPQDVKELFIQSPENWSLFQDGIDERLLDNPPAPGSHLKLWVSADEMPMMSITNPVPITLETSDALPMNPTFSTPDTSPTPRVSVSATTADVHEHTPPTSNPLTTDTSTAKRPKRKPGTACAECRRRRRRCEHEGQPAKRLKRRASRANTKPLVLVGERCDRRALQLQAMLNALATAESRASLQRRLDDKFATAKPRINASGTHHNVMDPTDQLHFAPYCDIDGGCHDVLFNYHKVKIFISLYPDTTLLEKTVAQSLVTSHLCKQKRFVRCLTDGHARIESQAQNNRRTSHQNGNFLCDCAPEYPPCMDNGDNVKVYDANGIHITWRAPSSSSGDISPRSSTGEEHGL
ncbi:MAG: hypothetical protein Q9192_005378 [Flavoplaca navasiana]